MRAPVIKRADDLLATKVQASRGGPDDVEECLEPVDDALLVAVNQERFDLLGHAAGISMAPAAIASEIARRRAIGELVHCMSVSRSTTMLPM